MDVLQNVGIAIAMNGLKERPDIHTNLKLWIAYIFGQRVDAATEHRVGHCLEAQIAIKDELLFGRECLVVCCILGKIHLLWTPEEVNLLVVQFVKLGVLQAVIPLNRQVFAKEEGLFKGIEVDCVKYGFHFYRVQAPPAQP